MLSFLLTPRWVVAHLTLVVGVALFVSLGLWQLRRLDEIRTSNALITERLAAPAASLEALASRYGDDADALAYRRVRAEGDYLGDLQVLTAPRSRSGRPGQEVLTPLETGTGRGVLVNRGWVPFDRELDPGAVQPVQGGVEVAGVLLPPEPGDVGDGELVARIAPDQLEPRLGVELLPVTLLLAEQHPSPAEPLLGGELPALDEGNHLSYAVQWFGFATIALIGYPLLVRKAAREREQPASHHSEVIRAARP